MKNWLFLFLLFPLLIAGCARYNPMALSNLSPDIIYETKPVDGLVVAAIAFSKSDCKRYLDRDVIKKGYQPIQLYIENCSNQTYFFSLKRVSLPIAPPEEVAKKVHTSTAARVAGYGAAAVVATPLFAIPAIVDGIKSSNANDHLDADFMAKAAKDQLIYPHSHLNMLIFVPREGYQETFSITFLEEGSHKPVKVIARAR